MGPLARLAGPRTGSIRVTRIGMIVGIVTAFWVVFIKDAEAKALGLCHALFGVTSLLATQHNWPVMDPRVVALPLSLAVLVVVSLFPKKPSSQFLATVFPDARATATHAHQRPGTASD